MHGEVAGGRGQRLHIDAPTRCEPIEDLFSEMNARVRGPQKALRHKIPKAIFDELTKPSPQLPRGNADQDGD